jgi:2-keto-4-pentenoate hydratase
MTPETLLSHADDATFWPCEKDHHRRHNVPSAYRDALAVRGLRVARGEQPVGFKVGFTNRTIWERYGVFAPIWGTVWNTTLTRCEGEATLDLTGISQPRLEPEVAFCMSATPPANASLEELFNCIEWLAPSFEVVQSHCLDWKFNAAEAVADGALHAHLLVGKPTPVLHIARSGADLNNLLAQTHLKLYRGQELIDEGTGSNVLDGPLRALLHFVHELATCPDAPSLQAGSIVTTGTWTDAWPIREGETWHYETDTSFASLRVAFR